MGIIIMGLYEIGGSWNSKYWKAGGGNSNDEK